MNTLSQGVQEVSELVQGWVNQISHAVSNKKLVKCWDWSVVYKTLYLHDFISTYHRIYSREAMFATINASPPILRLRQEADIICQELHPQCKEGIENMGWGIYCERCISVKFKYCQPDISDAHRSEGSSLNLTWAQYMLQLVW